MSRVLADLEREREDFCATLRSVASGTPANCGSWTAADLGVHLATGESARGLPNVPFRWLVGRGVRVDRMAPFNERVLSSYRRRRDLDWAIRRLSRPVPPAHRHGIVAAVTLLEFWAHHEDVLDANHLGPCQSGIDLDPVIGVLVSYQRRALDRYGVRVTGGARVWHGEPDAPVSVDGPAREVARWLSGRGSLDELTVSGDATRVDGLHRVRLNL